MVLYLVVLYKNLLRIYLLIKHKGSKLNKETAPPKVCTVGTLLKNPVLLYHMQNMYLVVPTFLKIRYFEEEGNHFSFHIKGKIRYLPLPSVSVCMYGSL